MQKTTESKIQEINNPVIDSLKKDSSKNKYLFIISVIIGLIIFLGAGYVLKAIKAPNTSVTQKTILNKTIPSITSAPVASPVSQEYSDKDLERLDSELNQIDQDLSDVEKGLSDKSPDLSF